MTVLTEEERDDVMKAALAKFGSQVDMRSKARKRRQRQAIASADRRSLRATGRDQQLNIKASARIKALLRKHVAPGNLSLWIVEAILAKLRVEGVDVDEA